MKRFSLQHVLPDDPQFEAVREVENRVFMRAFKNSPELMEQEYGPYHKASEFLAVVDNKNGRIAGFMRLIRHSPAGFKSLNDLEKAPWGGRSVEQILEDSALKLEHTHVLDIATLGVDVGYRAKDGRLKGALVSTALYHGLVKYSLEHGITNWVAVLDNKVLALVQAQGARFQPYHRLGSASYLDSPASTPVWNDFTDSLHRLPAFKARIFTHGTGLKTFVDIPDRFKAAP